MTQAPVQRRRGRVSGLSEPRSQHREQQEGQCHAAEVLGEDDEFVAVSRPPVSQEVAHFNAHAEDEEGDPQERGRLTAVAGGISASRRARRQTWPSLRIRAWLEVSAMVVLRKEKAEAQNCPWKHEDNEAMTWVHRRPRTTHVQEVTWFCQGAGCSLSSSCLPV